MGNGLEKCVFDTENLADSSESVYTVCVLLSQSYDKILPDLNSSRQMLFALGCTLAVWLHLNCGLSLVATDRVLKVLELLIAMAINFGRLLTQAQYLDLPANSKPLLRIPHDIRTAMATLSLEPKIIWSICCPKCYTKYSLRSLPEICL